MKTVAAIARMSDDGHVLCAPRLGRFSARVVPNQVVSGGVVIGTLDVAGTSYGVTAPAGVLGSVITLAGKVAGGGVEWGGELMKLRVLEAGTTADAEGAAHAGITIDASMDGQFYRRPSPDEAAFASPGDIIQPGQQIGLIEVMKFFYPVLWEGDAAVRIVSFVTESSQAVVAGDAIAAVEVPGAAGDNRG